jgi:hypothetical protein
MIPTAPQIGFDRFIQLDWVAAALKVRAGVTSLEELNELLEIAGLSIAARKKTRTVLNRLWMDPRSDLAEFATRGVDIYGISSSIPITALSWGMAIAAYPFFGRVAELVGRLSAIQGDCASAEVHRRMSELYGEREGTYRMTNMVLQSQANWGAIERTENGKRLTRKAPILVANDRAAAWLIEAALRYAGRAIPVATLQSMYVVYPFCFARHLGYLAASSPSLEVRSEGLNNQLIALRGAP